MIAYATYNHYPETVPNEEPILVYGKKDNAVAPFIFEIAADGSPALRVYGTSDLGIPIKHLPEFYWVYLSDLIPQPIQ